MTALPNLRCDVVAEWLAPPSDPIAALRAFAGAERLVGLVGKWADSGAIITADPLLCLARDDDPIVALASRPAVRGAAAEIVAGGWFGLISYDGPSHLAFYDHVLRLRPDGWYFEALVSDERRALLTARAEQLAALLDSTLGAHATASDWIGDRGWRVGAFGGSSPSDHLAAVEATIESIRAGEIYQANVCTRLGASFAGSTTTMFGAAVTALRPDYAGYVAGAGTVVASLSPELFLRRQGAAVTTSPIKGTAPHTSAGRDQLRRSAKDAAENVMIVDLMRNDLSRVSQTGSVRVPQLLEVQEHTGVWHLVSTVTGRLRESVDDAQLLAATFPPGSVTGAPKRRAIELMREIEGQPRGAYTGAVGFSSPSCGAEFSVAIRTFEIDGDRIELGVGGGVTADSVPMLEWRECLHKAAPLLDAIGACLDPEIAALQAEPTQDQLAGGLLETLLAIDGRVLRLADHLARLDRSLHELYGMGLPTDVAERVLASASAPGRTTIRVLWTSGEVRVEATPAPDRPGSSQARTVVRRSGVWRHKWADRAGYFADEQTYGTPLYVSPDGHVLETSRGNLFAVAPDGSLITPPLTDDLLPGVTRRALLDWARDTGRGHSVRPVLLDELRERPAFWVSSLSLAVPISSIDGEDLPPVDVAAFVAALT